MDELQIPTVQDRLLALEEEIQRLLKMVTSLSQAGEHVAAGGMELAYATEDLEKRIARLEGEI